MVWFRRRSARGTPAPGGDYAWVRDPAGAVIGLWLATPRLARDANVVDALLAKHGQWDLLDAGRRIEANDVDGRGGMFVMFGGVDGGARTEPDGRTLEVDGVAYPVHEDVEPFGRDVVAGRVALLKVPINDPVDEAVSPLFGLLADIFGPDSPQARAAISVDVHCLDCFAHYPRAYFAMRDDQRAGSAISYSVRDPASIERIEQIMGMTACVDCGGDDAVVIYLPERGHR